MSIRNSDARFMLLLKFGGDEGDRTPYLLNAIQALSQVSYTPTGSVPFLTTHLL